MEATATTVLARTAPTAPSERIIPIDALRGFAVLGILIMNIQSYSMIEAAYLNPTAYGDLTGINRWIWMLSHLFADEKFMGIFSILFGAGILLFTGRVEARGKKSAGLHYRRTFFLILIGLALGETPALGWLAVAYLGVMLVMCRRRLMHEFLPQFFDAIASLRPTHRHGGGNGSGESG